MEAVRHWLQPPVFPGDDVRTRRADVLNIALLATLCIDPVIIAGAVLGGHTPALTTSLAVIMLLVTLGAYYALRRGHVLLSGTVMLTTYLIIITFAAASLGTIRTPTTTLYLIVIIIAGALFDLIGILVFTTLSSLAVLGLVVAEMSGWLPRPDFTVTVTQWATISVLFGAIGLLSFFTLRRTRQALQRADRELAERQQIEAALRRSEGQLREAQHLAQVGSWEWDLQAQTLVWSDEVYCIFGVVPGELAPSAEAFESFIHPDDRDDFLRRRAQMLDETHTASIDHRIIRRDGEVRYVQERAQLVFDAADRACRVTGTVQDITVHKQMEEALRISDQRYRGLFEDSPISLWEEDFSQVKRYLDSLRQSGAVDLRTYLAQHPEAVNTCADLVRVLDVNTATLDLLEMSDKAAVLASLNRSLTVEAHAVFRDEISALAEGTRHYVCDVVQRTATGRERFITVNVSIAPGYADTWSKVLVSILDITERKQAVDALRESEERWSFALEGAGDGVWDWDVVTNRVFYSHQWKAMLGYADDEIRDDLAEWTDRIHPADLPALLDELQRHYSGQTPVFQSEHRLRAKDGTYRWILDRGRVVRRTPDGLPWRVIGTHSNITARKQMEEALRESEEKFRAIIEQSTEGVLLIDEQGCIIEWNRAQEQISGIMRAEALGQPVWDIQLGQTSPARRAQITGDYLKQSMLSALATGQSPQFNRPFEVPIETAAGEPRTILLTTFPIKTDKGYRLGSIVRDITDRKRIERAEHEQRQLAEALRDTAAALNSTLNLDEVFDRILANVERVVAHDTANLMLIDEHGVARIARHRGYAERGLIEFAARVRLTVAEMPNLQHMVETGQPRVMPNVRLDPDWIDWPESRYIQIFASAPIRVKDITIGFLNLNSATPGFYSAWHGERLQAFANQAAVAVENARLYEEIQRHSQQLEERVHERTAELLAANERLTELDRLKDEFMTRISHELRTPLTSIKIYLELLETGKPEKRDKYLQTLKRETDRLHVLIEDVLTITRLSQDTLDMELVSADLNRVLEPRLSVWQDMAARRTLAFRADLAEALPPARLDQLLTLQVVAQLINNAVSYTPAGSITLTTRACTDEAGQWLTVSIIDTGPGITLDDLPHIFERFYRGRAAADYKTPGTGVGLSIGREIAQKLGGRLTVETQVGIGSTFTLWLPLTAFTKSIDTS